LAFIATVAMATPYVDPDKIVTHVGQGCYSAPQVDATYNHLVEFSQIAGFEQVLQYIDPGTNFGGEREEEPGGGYWIVETDNTLEAIWVWSRYYELTGDRTYNVNINNAWVYAYNFPAWLEGAGYYSSHNCAWALAAERQYRETFGDSSHWDYAVNSANYILQTSLSLGSTLNVMVTGWCCGNLYLYGEATGNQQYMDVACDRAQEIINWVEASPDYRLGLESWAMSSGTFVWGICNSIFRRDPTYGQQWLETYGPMVQVFEPSQPSWSNAWNVAYCNAQGGMFDVSGDSTYFWNQLWLTNYLLHRDSDNDGGIPASAAGSIDADASWTTSYLAMMGCDRHIGDVVDAGVLAILSPQHRSMLELNIPIRVNAAVGNWGVQDLSDLMVTASGTIQETLFVDISVNENVRVDFGNWTPTSPGIDSIRVTIHAPGDTNSFNNSEQIKFYVQPETDYTNEESSDVVISQVDGSGRHLSLQLNDHKQLRLTLYNIQGREVATIMEGFREPGYYTLTLPNLSSGMYLLAVESTNEFKVKKLVILK
jgi:hypothetical protein